MKRARALYRPPYISKFGIRVVNSFMKLHVSARSFTEDKAHKAKLDYSNVSSERYNSVRITPTLTEGFYLFVM